MASSQCALAYPAAAASLSSPLGPTSTHSHCPPASLACSQRLPFAGRPLRHLAAAPAADASLAKGQSSSSAPARRAVAARAAAGGGTTSVQQLLNENKFLLLPGVYDALSATIVEKTGFQAGFISGYATSASLLGKPDFGLLT